MRTQHTQYSTPAAATRPLQPRELLVLQLRARGYGREQVAALLDVAAAAIEEAEHSACAALGAATVEEAVELAWQCRLIV